MWCKKDNQEMYLFDGHWGDWGRMVNCTEGFSAAKVQIEAESPGDETSMNCIQLYCQSSKSWEQG
jgi:hypothetical protein